jgi:hypothetical protein
MGWRADWMTDPSRDHDHCLDLFEDESPRAQLRWNDRGEAELMTWGNGVAIPAEWLVKLVQDFVAQTRHLRTRGSS